MAGGWRLAAGSREDVERLIREQTREIGRLKRELERVEEERNRYRRERDELEKQLETARRAAKRQAAPFSKGAPTPTPRQPGRGYGSAGVAAGAHAEVVEVLAPRTCPSCGAIAVEAVRVQYQAMRRCGRRRRRRSSGCGHHQAGSAGAAHPPWCRPPMCS